MLNLGLFTSCCYVSKNTLGNMLQKLKVQNYTMKIDKKKKFRPIFFSKFFLAQVISHIKTMLFIPTFTPNNFFGVFYGPKYFFRDITARSEQPLSA